MSDLRFRAITERVSDHGKLFYTPEQLVLYVDYRAVVQTSDDRNMIASIIALLARVFGVAMAEKFEAFVLSWLGPSHAAVHLSPFQENDVLRDAYGRWPHVYGSPPPGLLSREREAPDWDQPPPPTIRAALVCPDRPVRWCLHANGLPDHLGLALLPTAPPFTAGEQATLEVLRREPAIPVLVLHDASAEGCLLVEAVRTALDFSPRHRLIDLGLRPRDVMKHRLMAFQDRPSPASLQQLRARARLSAQSDAGPRPWLDATELKWLARGNYSPVRALTPRQLIRTVTRAVERAGQADLQPNDEAGAQQQAQALGFLSWPE